MGPWAAQAPVALPGLACLRVGVHSELIASWPCAAACRKDSYFQRKCILILLPASCGLSQPSPSLLSLQHGGFGGHRYLRKAKAASKAGLGEEGGLGGSSKSSEAGPGSSSPPESWGPTSSPLDLECILQQLWVVLGVEAWAPQFPPAKQWPQPLPPGSLTPCPPLPLRPRYLTNSSLRSHPPPVTSQPQHRPPSGPPLVSPCPPSGPSL